MRTIKGVFWPVLLLLAVLFVPACAALQPRAPSQPALTVQPSMESTSVPATKPPIEPTQTTAAPPVPTETIDPLALCPEPGADTSLHVDRQNGYCLLIPAGFSLQADPLRPGDAIQLIGPRQTLGPKQQEGITVMLNLEYNGPSEGMDSSAYAQAWHDRFEIDAEPVSAAPTTIGGQPATVLSNLSGFARQRAAFVTANGARYRISLMPQPEDMPELAEPAQRGWNKVLGSLVFFPPERPVQAIRALDVCPAATAEAKLFTSEIDGYCFLYPADFETVPDFPGSVTSNQVVGEWEAGEVRPSVTVGNLYGEPGLTPRQLLDKRIEFVQPGSIQDATVGGYPAVTFIDINGAWPSQQAIVVVEGSRSYSVLAQPVDAERFPEAPPIVQRGWETVIGSLRFFDPWR